MVYLERFRAMVNEIESHPLLEVVDFTINKPTTNELLTTVEERLGASLAEPIRNFYTEANGLRLYWKIKSGLTDEDLDSIEDEYDDYDIGVPDDEENVEEEYPFAQINLISLDDCILNLNWHNKIIYDELSSEDEEVEFAGKNYSERDFERRLKPFDLFSSYACMAFFLEEGIGNPKILRLSSHYVEWDNSRITDFASYLEMLLATRGIVEAREKIYNSYRGDRESPLVTLHNYWTQEHIPKLFRNK
ncbi:SMI1/KNR4 family protein [Cuspidothrix issatschenkoi LEGE 03284]|uniref:SMI1/KNR4 family protein n=1 Tax=Cuspidothrix issatschenkoi TaxID=230752 RepID=UPI00187E1E1D|nr:SMI1/KNR4 family protein [Cuspidothrix issatschenkoi]MBE9232467.1 SMI1/KNR4 family protein [Cuspidothrix issatschenkoi LEGE 03284]